MKVRIGYLERVEIPTLALIITCYGTWAFLIAFSTAFPTILWIILQGINLVLFWSITHEVVHGHPTDNALVNRLLVLLPIGFLFPYERFRDTHIQHHETGELTDPLDDPESWYLPQSRWQMLGIFGQAILHFNNTLFGRMLIGPLITLLRFYWSESRLILKDSRVRYVWALHVLLCLVVVAVIYQLSAITWWYHLIAIYLSLSFLLVRTFLEHQAAEDRSERTVIIEKSCPIAFLFLFNNLHAVHHARPGIPWYELPRRYRENRDQYTQMNGHYFYASYSEIFRRYFFRVKEPVLHPFLRKYPVHPVK